MINAIVRFAVRQRLLVLMAVALMAAAGIYDLARLPIDAVPDITNVQVQVLTNVPDLDLRHPNNLLRCDVAAKHTVPPGGVPPSASLRVVQPAA